MSDDVDILELVESLKSSRMDSDPMSQILKQRKELGEAYLEAGKKANEEVNTDFEEKHVAIGGARVQYTSFNAPALAMEYSDDVVERVVMYGLEGMSIAAIVKAMNMDLEENSPMAFKPHMIRAILGSTKGKQLRNDITSQVVLKSKDRIRLSAEKAVSKLIALMESESDKISLASAKELLRLANVETIGTEEKHATNETARTAEDEQLKLLARALLGDVK